MSQKMEILFPLYIYPIGEKLAAWSKIAEKAAVVPTIAIFAPCCGPGTVKDYTFDAHLNMLKIAGVKLLGYVNAQYGNRPEMDIRVDIQRYWDWWPGIDGIFIDEVSQDPAHVAFFQNLRAVIKTHQSANMCILNTGKNPQALEYLTMADGLVNYEGYAKEFEAAHMSPNLPGLRCGALLHGCHNQAQMHRVVDKIAQNNFHYIFVTNDEMPNPYDVLPVFWDAFVDHVARINHSRP